MTLPSDVFINISSDVDIISSDVDINISSDVVQNLPINDVDYFEAR